MLKFGCLPGVPVPAVRTARPLVESAGEPLAAGRVAAARWRHGHHSGIGRVGRAKVAWVVGDAGRVGIAHAPPGDRPATDALAYTVELLRSPTPTGGARAWWACPACGRRCAHLYLPPGRERLGCRTCCRLVYASQYPPRKRKRTRRRGPK